MGFIQYCQITYLLINYQPVNEAICIFIIMPIVFCDLVLLLYYEGQETMSDGH